MIDPISQKHDITLGCKTLPKNLFSTVKEQCEQENLILSCNI